MEFVDLLLRGFLLGGVYALVGLGLSVALGIMRVINVAHGDFAILSAYFAFVFMSFLKIDPTFTIVFVAPILFVIGYGLQKFLIARVLDMGLNQPVLVTFALSIVIQNILLLIFTSDARTLATGYWFNSINLGGLTLPLRYTFGFSLAIVTFLVLHFFFQKTYIGKAMRAVPIDIEAAKIIGIRPDKVYNFAMGIALLVTGLAGVLLGMLFTFYPDSGPTYLLLAFGVVVLGGLGSLKGTVIGGLIIGETLILAGYFLGSYYQLMMAYLVILAILVFRPQGIFGGVRF